MAFPSSQTVLLLSVFFLFYLARPANAFGAGNIGSTSRIEGQNWRHGDIEDTLLTILMSRACGGKKFSKLDVKRVYFGNWLRDYSQAVDVGTVKYVSAEAIRILLWVLGFMSFGYGSKEFEVTTARLGCYRPEEHIDNPKDYADNEDARQYDRRLRGPVDERKELGINPDTGLKNYISSEKLGITTSAGLVRRLFGKCIELGRKYARNQNKADLYEALRLLGTGCHCLEDFSAHSNYTELALIELGERDIFPHVGRRTTMQLRDAHHPVYPVITGTFGGVDFLHSVMGEFDDKATQSEIQELENTMQDSQNGDFSLLQDLLNKVPSGIFGGEDQAGKADELQQNATAHRMDNAHISPRKPEEWTRYLEDTQKQILPIIQWHDEILQSITETIDAIPILPDLIEQLQDQINIFVFSLLAPFVVPIIDQVKNELNTGSSEIIQSSVEKQHIVFHDDNSSDPTHSMLSKDHFSNVLNEPAGKVASQVLKWVVPQLIACWDNERLDAEETITRLIHGTFHHPALRGVGTPGAPEGRKLMFGVVESWWKTKSEGERQELRRQLSREGVERGLNHKPGVVDHGHGCGKPLGMAKVGNSNAASSVLGSITSGFGGTGQGSSGSNNFGDMAGEAVGGGALGAIIGGLTGGLSGNILGGDSEVEKSYHSSGYGEDGSYNQTVQQSGRQGDGYAQAQFSHTERPDGGHREEYTRHEQGGRGERTEYHEERRFESSGHGHRDEGERFLHLEPLVIAANSILEPSETFELRRHEDSPFESRRHEEREHPRHERRGENEYVAGGYGQEERRGQGREENKYNLGRREEPEFGSQQYDQDAYGRSNRAEPDFGASQYDQSGGYGDEQRSGHGERGERRRSERYGEPEQSGGFGGYESQSGGYRQREDQGVSEGFPGGYGRRDEPEESGAFQGGYGRREEQEMAGGFPAEEDESGGYGNQRRYGEQQEEGNETGGGW